MVFQSKIYISDKETVSRSWDDLSVRYHYSWLESMICKYLQPGCKTVLDIGPGFGHWIKFYEELGLEVTGLELSRPMAQKLNCFEGDIVHWREGTYDVVNAIGVLHHIMSDTNLIKALNNIKAIAEKMIFIGTRFDFFKSPKEKNRKFRPLSFWQEYFDIIGIERSNPGKLRKHLDLLICNG